MIRFKVYKIAENLTLKGCCDNVLNCPYETEKTSKIDDFGVWKTASFMCKAGTEKVSKKICSLSITTNLLL